jgi:hypothetical protein
MARSLGETIDRASIGALADGETEFMRFLAGLDAGESAISRHVGRRRALLCYAQQFGLLAACPIEREWEPVAEATRCEKGGTLAIVKHAQAHGLHPSEFSQLHVDAWKLETLNRGCTVSYVDAVEKRFRFALREAKLQDLFPAFSASKRTQPFSLRLEGMVPLLQADVSEIVDTLRTKAQDGTVRVGENLLAQLEALCGYAINVLGMTGITSVDSLLTKDFLKKYVEWLKQTRKCKRPAISNRLGGLHTVIRSLDRFRGKDFSWWSDLLSTVEYEPESAIKERRRSRGLRYLQLLAVPSKIRNDRLSAKNSSPKELTWLLHDELLMKIAVMLAWDASLIRACRISEPAPNLFKKPTPTDRSSLAFTPAATEARAKDKDVDLWQFNFEQEWGLGAYGFLICQVVPLLEEYLDQRPHLIDEKRGDHGCLFFRRDGAALTKSSLERLIGDISHKYAGKRVTPETIRNSFINYWLVNHPKDYINLANILMISLESVQVRFDPDYQRSFNHGNHGCAYV